MITVTKCAFKKVQLVATKYDRLQEARVAHHTYHNENIYAYQRITI